MNNSKSIVTKSLPSYSVSVGSPAKPIKKIFSDDDLLEHLSLLNVNRDEIIKTIEKRSKYFS